MSDSPDASDLESEDQQGWPEWANLPEAVPVQSGLSYAAQTAFLLRHTQGEVRMPPGFEYQKRPRDAPNIKKALDEQTSLVCDAYLTNACLSTVHESDLSKFLKCQWHELLAAGPPTLCMLQHIECARTDVLLNRQSH